MTLQQKKEKKQNKQKQQQNHPSFRCISPQLAFLWVSFCLGELGDGLNIFQGIYLVQCVGWKEGAVGAALSLMGLTSLLIQPLAGDWVDKATIDRRLFLTLASVVTAASASTILLVGPGDRIADHWLVYGSKIMEGMASSFIGPCLAALTMANFGPRRFDAVMGNNLFWGHVGSVAAAVLAGAVAYVYYPDNIRFCFLVIGASALCAIVIIPCLPQGDPDMGRGFCGKEPDDKDTTTPSAFKLIAGATGDETLTLTSSDSYASSEEENDESEPPQAASYLETLLDSKTCLLCFTGFFFQ